MRAVSASGSHFDHEGVGPVRELEREGEDVPLVRRTNGGRDGVRVDLPVADQGFRQAVQEAGEQPAAVEAAVLADVLQDAGLDSEPHGERGGLDELLTGPAVDAQPVAGMALEEDLHVGHTGVPPGDDVEDAALGRHDREPAALLGEQGGDGLRGGVIGEEPRARRLGQGLGGLGETDRLGHQVVPLGTLRLGGLGGGLVGGLAGRAGGDLGFHDGEVGALHERVLRLVERGGHGGEDSGLAVGRPEGDDDEEVGGLAPSSAYLDDGPAAGRGREDGEGEGAREVHRGLGFLGERCVLVSVFAVADTRRRETYCKGACGHAWHNLPAATEHP